MPEANWYPNPDGTPTERYWDGAAWTDQVRALPAPEPVPAPAVEPYWDGTSWTTRPVPAATEPQIPVPAGTFAAAPAAGGYSPHAPLAYQYGHGLVGPSAGGPLASPWRRLGARLIDVCIIVGTWLAIAAILVSSAMATSSPEAALGASIGLLGLFGVAAIAYEIGFIATKGATPGKMLLGLKVVAKGTSDAPGWGGSFKRYLPNAAGIIPFFGALVSFVCGLVSVVWIFTDENRQTVNDRLADTVVVRT